MDIPVQQKMLKILLDRKQELTNQIMIVEQLLELHYQREKNAVEKT